MTTPRIPPGDRRDIGTVNWALIGAGARIARVGGLPHLFTTMARHRSLFRAWLFFAGRLMPRGRLPRRDTELVILRTAFRSNCTYELTHHRRIARTAGLTASEVERAAGPSLEGWDGRDRALLAAADDLYERRVLGDESYGQLQQYLDVPETIEFLLLAGHYAMLASFINTLRIEADRPD